VINGKFTEKRQSNEGYRKLDLEERVLIFLTRIKRKRSFKEMGHLYGCGKVTAIRYYDEIVSLFCEFVVPNLVFPRNPADLQKMSSETTLSRFPHLLTILDATNWEQQTPENFLLNRMTYSAYKHFVSFQVLFGKYIN
jgi:hypothetical protein